MVCFRIEVVYPLQERQKVNLQNEAFIRHIAQHCGGDYDTKTVNSAAFTYVFRICHGSATRFLLALKPPFFIKEIQVLHTEEPVYINRLFYKGPAKTQYAPKQEDLKDAFWLAKSCERWQPDQL